MILIYFVLTIIYNCKLQNKYYKTGVINDPLGQTHSLTSSENCEYIL